MNRTDQRNDRCLPRLLTFLLLVVSMLPALSQAQAAQTRGYLGVHAGGAFPGNDEAFKTAIVYGAYGGIDILPYLSVQTGWSGGTFDIKGGGRFYDPISGVYADVGDDVYVWAVAVPSVILRVPGETLPVIPFLKVGGHYWKAKGEYDKDDGYNFHAGLGIDVPIGSRVVWRTEGTFYNGGKGKDGDYYAATTGMHVRF